MLVKCTHRCLFLKKMICQYAVVRETKISYNPKKSLEKFLVWLLIFDQIAA